MASDSHNCAALPSGDFSRHMALESLNWAPSGFVAGGSRRLSSVAISSNAPSVQIVHQIDRIRILCTVNLSYRISGSDRPPQQRNWDGQKAGASHPENRLLLAVFQACTAMARSFSGVAGLLRRLRRKRRRHARQSPVQTITTAPDDARPAIVWPAIPPASPV